MVADTAALIESLDIAPARIVGVSMGSYIAQELMVARPELVTAAVLMATRGRLRPHPANSSTTPRTSFMPPVSSCQSRMTRKSVCWKAFHARHSMMTRPLPTGSRCLDVADQVAPRDCAASWTFRPADNRLPAYRSIAAPVLVIGFADDLVTPPHLGREVADAMPNGRYLQIPDTGHLGFFERPQAVNAAALQFFAILRRPTPTCRSAPGGL